MGFKGTLVSFFILFALGLTGPGLALAERVGSETADPACIKAATNAGARPATQTAKVQEATTGVSATPQSAMGLLSTPQIAPSEGFIEPLEKPHPINIKFEIWAVSYPRGRENGPLYHIRVRQDMITQMITMEGPNFTKETTEYNQATDGLLKHLGYSIELDPRLGYVWKTQPSAELLSKLRAEWNERVDQDVSKMVHVDFKMTGADEQMQMLNLWLDGYKIGVADPFKGFEEFYIPNGTPPPSEEEINQCVINPTTGRAYERNGLYFHDAAQVINSLHLPVAPLLKTGRLANFWKEVYQNLIIRKRRGILTRKIGGPVVQRMIEALRAAHSPLKGQVDEAAGTMDEYTLFRIHLHHSMRGIHSITHILSWLILYPNGLKPGEFAPLDRGATIEQEFIIHVAGLGVKGPESKPPGAAPNLILNFADARVTDQPLTLEQAYDFITNGDIRRARQMVELMNDHQVNEIYNRHVQRGTFAPVPAAMLNQWTVETRNRYRGMTLD